MTEQELKALQTKFSSFKKYSVKGMSPEDKEAKDSFLGMYTAASKEKKKLLLSWSRAGGTKANLPVLCKKVLQVSGQETMGGNVGYMTPGRVAELARIRREMYDSIGEWKESLDAHIQQNQALHRESRPKGLEDMLLGKDYWASSFYYVHVADLEWQKQKRHEDHFVKEAEANKANVDQLMVGFEDPAASSTVQVEEMAIGLLQSLFLLQTCRGGSKWPISSRGWGSFLARHRP